MERAKPRKWRHEDGEFTLVRYLDGKMVVLTQCFKTRAEAVKAAEWSAAQDGIWFEVLKVVDRFRVAVGRDCRAQRVTRAKPN